MLAWHFWFMEVACELTEETIFAVAEFELEWVSGD